MTQRVSQFIEFMCHESAAFLTTDVVLMFVNETLTTIEGENITLCVEIQAKGTVLSPFNISVTGKNSC